MYLVGIHCLISSALTGICNHIASDIAAHIENLDTDVEIREARHRVVKARKDSLNLRDYESTAESISVKPDKTSLEGTLNELDGMVDVLIQSRDLLSRVFEHRRRQLLRIVESSRELHCQE